MKRIISTILSFLLLTQSALAYSGDKWKINAKGEFEYWKNGVKQKSVFAQKDNKTVFVGKDGFVIRGYQFTIGDKTYLTNHKGEIIKNAWTEMGYFNEKGERAEFTSEMKKEFLKARNMKLTKEDPNFFKIEAEEYINRIEPEVRVEFHKLINQHRANNNVVPLVEDSTLTEGSENKMRYMIDNKYYSHDLADGKPFYTLFNNGEQYALGENLMIFSLIHTDRSPKEVAEYLFESWKSSKGHNTSMLLPQYAGHWLNLEIGYRPTNTDKLKSFDVYLYASDHFITPKLQRIA